ncbi:hypothetical protein [Streptomyces sp. NPDC007088]|uniref:hypothetical protein n=1 Tax=Streptomyces sp. NPDC007088 TaxID=3364773 RepID=UPI0036A2DCF5
MTAQRWTQAVRDQVAFGGLLPLGDGTAGAWLAESAAVSALRHAGDLAPGVRLERITLIPTRTDDSVTPQTTFPAPPTALPPGPLRLSASFAACVTHPLPETAATLRVVLLSTARDRLGLAVARADLRVTDLLDEDPRAGRTPTSTGQGRPLEADESRVPEGIARHAATAARSVDGVAGLGGAFGGHGRPVRLGEAREDGSPTHVRVEVVATDLRPLPDTVRAVRSAVGSVLEPGTTVTVLVTGWLPDAGNGEAPA